MVPLERATSSAGVPFIYGYMWTVGADSASNAITGSSRGIGLLGSRRDVSLFVAVSRADFAMFSGLSGAADQLLASLVPR
jgi:hypothetical protein